MKEIYLGRNIDMPERKNEYKGTLCYDGLFRRLNEKGLTQKDLREKFNLSPTLVSRLRKNSNVSLDTLLYLCDRLNCKLQDIVQYTPEGGINCENSDSDME